MNLKTESKASQTVAIVAVTSVNTIVYTSKENSEQVKEIEKGFDPKRCTLDKMKAQRLI